MFPMSRDDLSIEQAMWRAELLALGASDELVQARAKLDMTGASGWLPS